MKSLYATAYERAERTHYTYIHAYNAYMMHYPRLTDGRLRTGNEQ